MINPKSGKTSKAAVSASSALRIIDAQAHIWDASSEQHPWPSPEKPPQREAPYLVDELVNAMDEAGVAGAILVPPSWVGDFNGTALAATQRHPHRFAVMGRIALDDALAGTALLKAWRDQPGMLGLRLTFQTPRQRALLESGATDWLWPAAENAGIPVMMLVPELLGQAADIARSHPKLQIAIDHLGTRRGEKDNAAFADARQLLALSKFDNIAVKATAIPDFSTEAYPYRNLHSHLREIITTFGPRRVFWGADHTRLPCSYRQAITMFTEEMSWLDQEALEWIMGRGLCEWLRWSPPDC